MATKHASVSKIPRSPLRNSPLNTSLNHGGILGSSVFCAVCVEAVKFQPVRRQVRIPPL
jgi:hypothetical protein